MNKKDYLILINKNGEEIGSEEKVKCHIGKGLLHKAFSIFLFNNKKELLLQQRSKEKMLWGEYWTNTCCSHPRIGENILDAANKRLMEELNLNPVKLKCLYNFFYNAKFKNIGSENEHCSVIIGKSNEIKKPNPDEVMDLKWISLKNLQIDIEKKPNKYTPWFKMELKELNSKYKNSINKLIN